MTDSDDEGAVDVSGLMPSAGRFATEFEALLKKHGVGTFVLLFRDPDLGTSVTRSGGEIAWRMGAVRGMQLELDHLWQLD